MSDCLIWCQVCLLSSLVTLSLKAPVLSVSVRWSLNVFPAVPASPVFHVEWLKPLVLWTPCLLVPESLTCGHRDRRTNPNNSYLYVHPPFCFPYFPSVFFFPLCFPIDPLLRPEFLLLLLEQEDRSLEDHTRLFQFLANTTSYPDDVRRWSSRGFRRLRGVDSGEKRIAPHSFPRGWSRQIHSRPRAQPTISPRYGASARAHRWRRAISRHDLRASAKPSDWADDRPGSRAQPVRSGARAGDNAHHEGACRGRCECGVELRPLHRGGGGADSTSGTAGHGGGLKWLGDWAGVRDAPSPLSVIPAGPVQPWGGFRFSSARSSPAPSRACSLPASSHACSSPAPSSAPAGSVQLSRAPAGSVRLSSAPVGSVRLSSAPAGSVRLPRAPAGSVRLPRAPNVRASRAPPGVRTSWAPPTDEEFPQEIFLGGATRHGGHPSSPLRHGHPSSPLRHGPLGDHGGAGSSGGHGGVGSSGGHGGAGSVLNVFPAVPASPVFHVEWLKPLVLWTPCLLVPESLTRGHRDNTLFTLTKTALFTATCFGECTFKC